MSGAIKTILKLAVDNTKEVVKQAPKRPFEATLAEANKVEMFAVSPKNIKTKTLVERQQDAFPDIIVSTKPTGSSTGAIRKFNYNLKTASGDADKNSGIVVAEDSDIGRRVLNAYIDPSRRGTGMGTRLYGQAIIDSFKAGDAFLSGASVSSDAMGVWAKLKKAGFAVETNPQATFKGGNLVATGKDKWVFRIAPPKKKDTETTDELDR